MLTAVLVTQMSLDASVTATIEYFVGTLGGAIYAVAIAFLAPHNGEISLVFTLALAVAPLAFLAAVNSSFRVGPFTAVIIILGATATHIGPIDCSAALLARCAAPSVDAASMALTDYAATLAAAHGEQLAHDLSPDDLERIFALSFGLEQLHADFIDLTRSTHELAKSDSARAA